MEKKKITAIIQARYNSTRLRGKVLKKIGNKTILEIIVYRLKKSKKISNIIIACSDNHDDQKIISLCKKKNFNYFIGSENNVLKRYYDLANKKNINNIVRITSDCPFIDHEIVDKVIDKFLKKKLDYCSNILPPTYPDGFDAEVFTFKSLKESYLNAKDENDKEHVTQYMQRNKNFKKYNVRSRKNFSNLRLTIDENVDLKTLRTIFKNSDEKYNLNYRTILSLYKKNKSIFKSNMHISRNMGKKINIGQKFWKRANKVIPGGTMLFSKNPNLFLPEFWPSYFKKTKGINILALDNKTYKDFALMGVGTNILGYSNNQVDREVQKIVRNGNMSSFNSVEEIFLAEKLIDMHKWSDMARFTRTGGEAASVAIRLSRAATKKEKVAICGYHGWHDWYLSTNLTNSNNLNKHLMTNTPISGVQKKLKRSAFAFDYNNFEQLNKISSENNLAAIIMEVSRNTKPKKNFLKKIRDLATKKNIVLIFDECTSGFRETYGGLHLKFGVNPDLALFGKALGNGYAINAILGKKSIMEFSNKTFMSSTFWTERIGPTAANKTLDIMEKYKTWEFLTNQGIYIKEQWKKIADNNNVKINIEGLNALPKFSFLEENNILKTFITQEFLKNQLLALNSIYICIDHTKSQLKQYFEIMDKIFYKINLQKKRGHPIINLLDGKPSIFGLREEVNKKLKI